MAIPTVTSGTAITAAWGNAVKADVDANTAHAANTSNPHNVTAAQVGAVSLARDLSRVSWQEDFQSSGTTNTVIGSYGWATVGGTLTNTAAEASHPGIVTRSTGTTSGTTAATYLRSTAATGVFLPADTFDLVWIVRLNTNDANTTMRVGAGNDASVSPPANGLYLEKLDADTNWFVVARASSTQTRTDTGVATGTGWNKIRIRRVDASTVGFTLNAGSEITITTNIPTAALQPMHQIVNSAAAAKTCDLDYFDLLLTGLTR